MLVTLGDGDSTIGVVVGEGDACVEVTDGDTGDNVGVFVAEGDSNVGVTDGDTEDTDGVGDTGVCVGVSVGLGED